MKSCKRKTGVTLVEILIVVAIIAILVTMVIGIATRVDTQGKEQLTKNTIALLDAALGEFGDYGYRYSDSNYADFKFPLDCNNFNTSDFETKLGWTVGGLGTHDVNYSGSEALYFFLSRVPDCRQTLDKIDKSLITNKGSNGADMTITIDGKGYPLLRIIDPWRETLRYDYYNEKGSPTEKKESKKTFPVITSAGPDKEFGSADDITSRD
jgi:prepilin-type N-terminal cleavage/methylation domain-containing protein